MGKEIKNWLALSALKARAGSLINGELLKGLLDAYKDPGEIFKDNGSRLRGLSPEARTLIKGFDGWERVAEETALIKRHGARVITYDDGEYPALLKEIPDPPCLLYAKGRTYDHKVSASVAVVGTRRPTHYGLSIAEVISRDLASMGVVVVSGMARGCDMAAHKGALTANGMTVAVLGTGIDIAYPRENKALYDEVSEKGLLISEFPMSTPPVPFNFPKRNRIISGLSKGVLVIEAPLKSGALMTARLALEFNRDVLAVPGAATSAKSRGTNKLIKEGAALVESAQDVMDALSLKPRVPEKIKEQGALPALGVDERLVLKVFGDEPLHIDTIAEKTGLTTARASALLLDMELSGIIGHKPGGLFFKRY